MRLFVKIFLLLLPLLFHVAGFGQTYRLTQGFFDAEDDIPPPGWRIVMLQGDPGAVGWRFDNPGSRMVMPPLSAPFAILDAGHLSQTTDSYTIALESRTFSAGQTDDNLLMFDHQLVATAGVRVSVEAYNGSTWVKVADWTDDTPGAVSEIIDIADIVRGVAGARVRFVWEGSDEGYWAIDNIRVLAAHPVDAGLVQLASPLVPFAPGEHPVIVTLANYGSQQLTSATINWQLGGGDVQSMTWSGSLAFGQSEDVALGIYDIPGSVDFAVWLSEANGAPDVNPDNDRIERTLRPAMEGTYTIGGTGPDFNSFLDAVTTISLTGITGPVKFRVRPGNYNEAVVIGAIAGVSEQNLVSFESENADPETTRLANSVFGQTALSIHGSAYLRFYQIGFSGYIGIVMETQAHHITFEQCRFTATATAMQLRGGSNEVRLYDNYYSGADSLLMIGDAASQPVRDVDVSGCTFSNASIRSLHIRNASNVSVGLNQFENVKRGLFITGSSDVDVIKNKIQITAAFGHENTGLRIDGSSDVTVINNHISTQGAAVASGVRIHHSSHVRIYHNSVDIGNTDVSSNSRGLYIEGGSQNFVMNNIFNIRERGLPVFAVGSLPGHEFDYNNYFSPNGIIGSVSGQLRHGLAEWRTATGQDMNSTAEMPFFGSFTDPSVNQVLLSGAADPSLDISIADDLAGVLRDPVAPTIGAMEFIACDHDAGINGIISPGAVTAAAGVEDEIIVVLQNHGSALLTNVWIDWSVTSGTAVSAFDYFWTEGLSPGDQVEVNIGSFDFGPGNHLLHISTREPDGFDDCRPENDAYQVYLSGALCGPYTLGGSGADFSSFSEAVAALNTAGISCDVTFIVRDGIYEEQIEIQQIQGSDSFSVTFRSENGPNAARLVYPFWNQSPLILKGVRNMHFEGIGLLGHYALVIDEQSQDLLFEACRFEVYDQPGTINTLCVEITGGSRDIRFVGNVFQEGFHSIKMHGFGNRVRNIQIIDNTFESPVHDAVFLNPADDVLIHANRFHGIRRGVLAGSSNRLTVSSNWIYLLAEPGQSNQGIYITGSNHSRLVNNFIVSTGPVTSSGIRIENSNNTLLAFNSINISNQNLEDNNYGVIINGGENYNLLNNIFKVERNGFSVWIGGGAVFSADFNNYHTHSGFAAHYEGQFLHSIAGWITATAQDSHSMSIDPFFSSPGASFFFEEEGPVINQVLLSETGVAVTGVVDDIIGKLRDTAQPGIGAWIFEQQTVDAGINGFVEPASPVAGTANVTVTLQNHGTESLHSVTIRWDVDGVEQPPFSWPPDVGSLAPRDSVQVGIGQFAFSSGLYTIRAWTHQPNGQEDQNSDNDMATMQVLSGLSGSYTIGGSNPDFVSFRDAVDVLNAAGITGDVTFFIRDGDYEEQFIIEEVWRAANDLTITFVAEDPSGSGVRILQPPGNFWAVKLRDIKNIRFENIALQGFDTVIIEGESSHIDFENCRFSAAQYAIEVKAGIDHLRFHNNTFNGGNHAIFMRRDGVAGIEDVSITGNEFFGPSMEAIHAFGVKDLVIRDNHFGNIRRGILAVEVENLVIRENWFIIQTSPDQENMGLRVENSYGIRIYNNFISSTGTDLVRGLWIKGSDDTRIYFNTINITNNVQFSRALLVDGGSSMQVMNNIFSMKQAGIPVYIETMPAGLQFFTNAYWHPTGRIGQIGGQSYTDLSLWSNDTGDNTSFNHLNPGFPDDQRPEHNQPGLINQAQPLVDIQHDIFGVLRHPASPDVGCYESFIDYGITDLVIPDVDCNTETINTVTVGLMQSGKQPLDELRLAFQVNDGDIHEEIITGFAETEMAWTFDVDIDLTLPGEYEFRAWLPDAMLPDGDPQSLGDQWPENNEVSVMRKKYNPPTIVAGFDYACDMIYFESEVTFDTDDPINSSLWLFGDGGQSDLSAVQYSYGAAGIYQAVYRVTTESGCVVEHWLEVLAGDPGAEVSVDHQVIQSCGGGANGSIELIAQGATSPYFVSLDAGLTWEESDAGLFSFSGLEPDTYSFLVRDILNCNTSLVVEVEEVPEVNPVIDIPDQVYIPTGIALVFSSDHGDYGAVEWLVNGEFYSSDISPDFFFSEPGTFSFTLNVYSGPAGECMQQDIRIVNAALPPLDVVFGIRQQYCQADAAPFITLTMSGGVPPYRILVNGSTVETTSGSVWTMPNPIPGQRYDILVMDEYGQIREFVGDLVQPVVMNPIVMLTDAEGQVYLDTYEEVMPFEITLSFVSDDQPEFWIWRIGNMTETASANPLLRFDDAGIYEVVLEVHSGEPGNCVEIARFTIESILRVEIGTVDVFSPNGDGVNDYFEVIHRGLVSLEVDIFDRRGRHVYHFNELDGRWDGDYRNGQPAPDGMYPFFLRATGFDGLTYERSGMVQLIRDAILVFPNPAVNQVSIDPKGNMNGPVDIDIIDLRGNTVMTFRQLEFNDLIQLNISGLEEGHYVVRVSDQKNVFHHKLRVVR